MSEEKKDDIEVAAEAVESAQEAVKDASDAVDETCENINQTQTGADASENQSKAEQKPIVSSEVLCRIGFTLLFGVIGWLSLMVFAVVVLVQFGFLLFTGEVNKNLKAFNGELGDYLADIIKYVAFQIDKKPFPFQSWQYGETTESTSKEANSSS